MTTARCYYEILEVERTVGDGELKTAFRKLAMVHHPDRNAGDKQAESRFKELTEAYSILSDPNKRAAYDRYGHAGVNGGQGPGGFGAGAQAGFGDIHDIFNEVFGEAFGEVFGARRSAASGPARGQDLRYDLEIFLEQAYAGADVEIMVPAALICEACHGSGAKAGTSATTCTTCAGQGRVRANQGFFQIERTCPRCGGAGKVITDPCLECRGQGQVRREHTLSVRIPAGVDDGARIRLQGEGDAGGRGGPRGDLYIFISVKPHELFERDGLDLHCAVPVSMCMAALGGELEAPCLMGAHGGAEDCRATIKVPEGAQTGRTVRLKGKGMPSLRSRERGDLVVELFVETPTKLNARQKELMRELAESCGAQHHPRSAGFLNKAKRFWDDITGCEA